MDRDICRDSSSTKSRHKWICRGAVKNLSTTKIPRWIEKLLRIYQPNRKLLDELKKLSSIYWEEIQKPWWIEIEIRSVETRRRKGLIEENLSINYREAIELEEKEFFKEEKHKEINATSKLLKHRFNQHIKLSEHLSTYMESIQDPKHTHTH